MTVAEQFGENAPDDLHSLVGEAGVAQYVQQLTHLQHKYLHVLTTSEVISSCSSTHVLEPKYMKLNAAI